VQVAHVVVGVGRQPGGGEHGVVAAGAQHATAGRAHRMEEAVGAAAPPQRRRVLQRHRRRERRRQLRCGHAREFGAFALPGGIGVGVAQRQAAAR
jgi:hypothetical protein